MTDACPDFVDAASTITIPHKALLQLKAALDHIEKVERQYYEERRRAGDKSAKNDVYLDARAVRKALKAAGAFGFES